MKWKKYTISTTTEAVDLISELCSELGIEGIEIEDSVPLTDSETKGMFIDILPELPPDDGSARVSYYLDDTYDAEEILQKVKDGLEELRSFVDIGEGTVTAGETEDKDWINNWKEFFHPFTVDDILIKPTWEPLPEDANGKMVIQIDPGTAFGTGQHETTQLCIRAIRKHMKPGDRVLDLGTGSGILSIVALKLGAESACGTDLDENVVHSVSENLEANELPSSSMKMVVGNIIDDENVKKEVGGEYDLAIANILAPVIILLVDVVPAHLKKGHLFITSGIIGTMADAVREKFESSKDFEIVEENVQGEWVSFVARRV